MKKLQPNLSMKTKRRIIKLRPIINPISDFMDRLSEHAVTAYAAQSAFFMIISFFPFVMLLLTLLNYLPIPLDDTGGLVTDILPATVTDFINGLLEEIHINASGTVISVTAVTALWAASKGLLAIRRGMNSVYENTESRNYIIIRFYSIIETLAFIILLIVMLVIIVFGNTLYKWLSASSPVIAEIAALIMDLRGIAGLAILILFFDLVYVIMPNRRGYFLKELPGAALTAVGWIGFSYLYAFYVDNIANYSSLYGSLTTIVLLMVWLYICMYMLFIGGEINCLLNETDFWDRFKKKKRGRKASKA